MGFRTQAPSLSELYAQAALALTSILVGSDSGSNKSKSCEKVEVTLEGPDLDELMFAWLSEVLYQFDGERNILLDCESMNVKPGDAGYTLDAALSMTKFDAGKHRVKTYVKAITFHQMNIENTGGNYTAQVYVDI